MAATLTLVAIKARKTIRYGLFLLIFIIIGRLFLIAGLNAYRNLVPKKPPAPTVGFKRLTNIPFPNLNIELPELVFTIDTPSGSLPSFPTQMNIYAMPPKTATLFSFDNMKAKAAAFGYTSDPVQTTETLYSFTHPKVPATFKTDVVYETFSLSFNLAEDSDPLTARPPDIQSATDLVKSQLKRASSMPEDLDTGTASSEFLRVEGQNLVRALALSDAQLTKINLHRKTLTDKLYPSVTANPKESNVWFIVSGSKDRDKTLIAGEFHYFPIDETRVETYPIISPEDAIEKLKNGKGYIANLGLNTNGQVTIRNIYLAYYDPNVPYSYYQPVVVFEGDGEFSAYVPAVTDQYYGEEAPATK